MVSKNDLLVGVLVLIAGFIIYEFAPPPGAAGASWPGSGALFQAPNPVSAHNNTHFAGGVIAIIFGAVAFALMKKTSKITWAVGALSVIVGLVFILDAATYPLYSVWVPHGQAMQTTGAVEILVGLVGIGGAFTAKKTS